MTYPSSTDADLYITMTITMTAENNSIQAFKLKLK